MTEWRIFTAADHCRENIESDAPMVAPPLTN